MTQRIGRVLVVVLSIGAMVTATAGEVVTVETFVRAESDRYFQGYVDKGGFGDFIHRRNTPAIDDQSVIRMNRDTLYSVGVFDLEQPLVVHKPETDGRFQSMQIISQDHHSKLVVYDAGDYTVTREMVGTRYAVVLFRTLVDADSPADIETVNAIQDRISASQESKGQFVIPDWDTASLDRLRDAINVLGSSVSENDGVFGDVGKVDPILHLIGTAYGWGGNPRRDAMYLNVTPDSDSNHQSYEMKIGDVPVDGFWSISLYNRDGYFEVNEFSAYSLNNLTATRDEEGCVTIRFGGDPSAANYFPIFDGWNYVIRLYQPHEEAISGSWTFPTAQPVQ